MQRAHLRVLFLYNGLFVLAGNLLGPLYGLYAQQLKGSITTVSMSWIVLLVSTTFFSIFLTGPMGRAERKENLLLAGYLVRALAWMGFMFITSINELLVLQALLGLGEALGSPAFDALFAEKMNANNRIGEYARWKLVSNVMTMVGIGLGGVIVASFGFTALFGLMALLAMFSFIGLLLHGSQSPDVRAVLPTGVLEWAAEYRREDQED